MTEINFNFNIHSRDLWAKTDRLESKSYHPCLYHLADVAHVARLIWRECLPGAARSLVEMNIGVYDQAATAVVAFLAGLHDIGKASPAFQRLRVDLAGVLEEAGLTFGHGETKPHGTITAKELKTYLRDDKSILRVGPKTATAEILSKIAGAHHGVFAESSDLQQLGVDSLGDSNWAEVRYLLNEMLWQMLNGDNRSSIELKEPESPTIVPLLAGLISVADWIGSNTDYFPFDSETDPTPYFQLSEKRAECALKKIGWLPMPSYAEKASFNKIFGFGPNEMQCAVVEQINKQKEPFLLAIEAQMGQGKTEAALYAADFSLCAGQSRGLYVALPTQATSNAMFARIKNDYLNKRGHSGIEDNMQLVHGNTLLDKLLKISGICEENSGEESSVSASSWFTSRKRSLLAPFGVGTIDQALLGILQTRHWFVRLFGLANKVIVFDEVHAYDTYTSTLLDRLIEWLSALDCTVILLSATLPKKRLSELVAAYGGTQLAEIADYPRITLAGCSEEPFSVSVDVNLDPKPVSLEFESDEASNVARLVTKRLADGGCAAVICNTVNRAQDVHKAIEDELVNQSNVCDLILFHARTPFAWRKETEDEVLRKFGKPNKDGNSPNRPHRAIVVATSVIEQSLDLDFDWILTDMAPIDLVLQRLGREHRHNRPPRPLAVNSPVLTILSDGQIDGPPPEFDNAGIYERHILLRSWLAISKRTIIELPGDIDHLVQWVYGDEEPTKLANGWDDDLKTSLEDYFYRQGEDAKKADKVLVPTAKGKYPEDIISCDAHNKQLGEDDDPDVHESVKVATRDGDPSIKVVCLNRQGDKLFPVCGKTQVDLQAVPDVSLTAELLASSLSIQTKGIYHALRQQETPAGWKKSPHLRYHRSLEFVNGESCEIEGFILKVSKECGLRFGEINKGF